MFTRGYPSQPRYRSYTEVTKIVHSPHVNECDMQKHWCCVTLVRYLCVGVCLFIYAYQQKLCLVRTSGRLTRSSEVRHVVADLY